MPDAERRTPDFQILTPARRKVLAHIASYCGERRWMVQSNVHMAEATGLSSRTVSRPRASHRRDTPQWLKVMRLLRLRHESSPELRGGAVCTARPWAVP